MCPGESVKLCCELGTLGSKTNRFSLARTHVPRDVFRFVDAVDALLDSRMKIDDSAGDGVVGDLIAFVDEDEEEIESGHDGRRHGDVVLQRPGTIVPPA